MGLGATEPPLQIEGYWEGLPVTAKGWASISDFERAAYVTPPARGSSSCSGAGGCTGPGGPPDWGVWTFHTKDGKNYTGLLTGGFGIDRLNTGARTQDNKRIPVGLFPKDVLFSTHQGGQFDSGRFEIEVSPSYTVQRLDFSRLAEQRIELELINGRSGTLQVGQQQAVDLSSNGFLIWSKLGDYQVRCLLRVKDLSSMELVESDDYATLKGFVDEIAPVKTYWAIETGTGKEYIKAIAIRGNQKQLVPIDPPPGKYWTVRPPKKPGEIAGDYFVSPNGAGYFLIPFGLVAEMVPKQKLLRLRSDAGGENIQFTRFHPGRYGSQTVPAVNSILMKTQIAH